MPTGIRYRLQRSDGTSWMVAEGERLSLGRSRQSDVQIADSGVSRRHATLLVARGRCWIRDEESMHGTFVNGQRVAGQQEFRPGDELRIGSAVFRLERVTVPTGVRGGLPHGRQRRQVIWGVVSAVVVIVVLAIALSAGGDHGRLEVSAVAQVGEDLVLSLGDGASLSVLAGGVEPGGEVTYRRGYSGDAAPSPSEDTIRGPIYEVNTDSQLPGMQAIITLPIERADLSPAEMETVQIAYLEDGHWVTVASTVDADAMTVSGVLTHFSLSTWVARVLNNAPKINIQLDPTVYSEVTYDYKKGHFTPVVDPLQIDLTVMDREGKMRAVKFGLACYAQSAWGFESLNELRSEMVNHFQAEMNAGIIDWDFTAPQVGIVVESFRPPDREISWCLEPQLLESPNNGHKVQYHISQDISISYPDKLDKLRLYVYAWDDLDEPTEAHVDIPLTAGKLPETPHLKSPGPIAEIVCPAQPEFHWSFDGSRTKSYALFLKKGTYTNVFLGKPTMYRWTFDDGFMGAKWTPEKPLKDGIHSWGIVASIESRDRDFDDPTRIAPSTVYQFRVDQRLEGSDCYKVPFVDRPKAWATLSVDGQVVTRSEVEGRYKGGTLRWTIPYADDTWEIRAEESMWLDLSGIGIEPGTYTVYLKASYDGSDHPISNQVLVTVSGAEPLDVIETETETEESGGAGVISADDLISGTDDGIDGLIVENETGGVVRIDIVGPYSAQGVLLPPGPPKDHLFGVPPGQYELTFEGCDGKATSITVSVPGEGAARVQLDCSDF
jgi:hypothetical protein